MADRAIPDELFESKYEKVAEHGWPASSQQLGCDTEQQAWGGRRVDIEDSYQQSFQVY